MWSIVKGMMKTATLLLFATVGLMADGPAVTKPTSDQFSMQSDYWRETNYWNAMQAQFFQGLTAQQKQQYDAMQQQLLKQNAASSVVSSKYCPTGEDFDMTQLIQQSKFVCLAKPAPPKPSDRPTTAPLGGSAGKPK